MKAIPGTHGQSDYLRNTGYVNLNPNPNFSAQYSKHYPTGVS